MFIKIRDFVTRPCSFFCVFPGLPQHKACLASKKLISGGCLWWVSKIQQELLVAATSFWSFFWSNPGTVGATVAWDSWCQPFDPSDGPFSDALWAWITQHITIPMSQTQLNVPSKMNHNHEHGRFNNDNIWYCNS